MRRENPASNLSPPTSHVSPPISTMTIPHDYHTHTNFSCDSKATMAEMCRAAV